MSGDAQHTAIRKISQYCDCITYSRVVKYCGIPPGGIVGHWSVLSTFSNLVQFIWLRAYLSAVDLFNVTALSFRYWTVLLVYTQGEHKQKQ